MPWFIWYETTPSETMVASGWRRYIIKNHTYTIHIEELYMIPSAWSVYIRIKKLNIYSKLTRNNEVNNTLTRLNYHKMREKVDLLTKSTNS